MIDKEATLTGGLFLFIFALYVKSSNMQQGIKEELASIKQIVIHYPSSGVNPNTMDKNSLNARLESLTAREERLVTRAVGNTYTIGNTGRKGSIVAIVPSEARKNFLDIIVTDENDVAMCLERVNLRYVIHERLEVIQ